MGLKDILASLGGARGDEARPAWIWHIDRPSSRPVTDAFEVHGWLAGRGPCTLCAPDGAFRDFQWIDRPDLRPPPGGHAWARGFELGGTSAMLDAGVLHARASDGDTTIDLAWTFRDAVEPVRKRRKLERIRQELLRDARVARETQDYLDFLPAEAMRVETHDASGYNYPDSVNALIARHADGWILDCGAGSRPVYHDNVVNLDLVPYPATDVLADAQALPFRDACFDGIVTLAALEHVKRPWIVACELVRVLKPGGTLIADVPFLQPGHAFPDHYFNMTAHGLVSLFEESCDVVRSEVPHYGEPIYTLAWFLQRYADGLPEPQREAFTRMSVADLQRPAHRQAGDAHVTALAEAARFELASVTTLVARKR